MTVIEVSNAYPIVLYTFEVGYKVHIFTYTMEKLNNLLLGLKVPGHATTSLPVHS